MDIKLKKFKKKRNIEIINNEIDSEIKTKEDKIKEDKTKDKIKDKTNKTKIYYSATKITNISIIFICAVINYFSTISLLKIIDDWDIRILQTDSVFETQEFHDVLTYTIDTVILNDIYYGSEENILNGYFINDEELFKGFKQYYGIVDSFMLENIKKDNSYEMILEDDIPTSLTDIYKRLNVLLDEKLPIYRTVYTKKQLEQYNKNNLFIQELKSFYYHIEDTNGNFISGNASDSDIKDLSRKIIITTNGIEENFSDVPFVYENQHIDNSDYIIKFGIREPLYNNGVFYELDKEYSIAKTNLPFLLITIILTWICILSSGFYIVKTAGQSYENSDIKFLYIDKIYNDIQFIFYCLIITVFTYLSCFLIEQIFTFTNAFWINIFIILLCLNFVAFIVGTLTYATSISRQIKSKVFIKNTCLYYLFYKIEYINNHKTFKKQFIAKLVIYAVLNSTITYFMISAFSMNNFYLLGLASTMLLLINYLFFKWISNLIHSIQIIMSATKQASLGNLDEHLNLDNISIAFLKFAEDLISIQNNYKTKIEEAIKAEELKTELIANVSHDLRTPLTSIISYIDILANLENDKESTEKYIKVVHNKAYRLNQLIEDLIEASKVSSGTLTMIPIPINFRQLCIQCIAELEEMIENFKVEIIVNCDSKIIVYADGRHVARVIENITSNAIKYSVENSRIFIDIFQKDDKAVLSIKNTSDLDINYTKEQFVARFFRADEARSTEGTGLGLSIAESLTLLQNGEFDIKVDGNSFKVIIVMPLWIEEENK